MIDILWPMAALAVAMVVWDIARRWIAASYVDRQARAALEELRSEMTASAMSAAELKADVERLGQLKAMVLALDADLRDRAKQIDEMCDAHNKSLESFNQLVTDVRKLKNVEVSRQMARPSGR